MAIVNYAQEAFSTDSSGQSLTLIPRQKFNFKLVINTPTDSITFDRVSNVSYPGISFETATLSQYNVKRVIQTKMNYEAMTVTFYDTFDSQAQTLFKQYIAHYYNKIGLEDGANNYSDSVINQYFSTNVGYTPVTDRYFFSKIQLIQLGGPVETDRITVLHNSIILNIQGDTLDYSDSTPVMFTVQFQPEKVTII